MFDFLKSYLFLMLSVVLLTACGESDAPQEQTSTATETVTNQQPTEVVETVVAVVEQSEEVVAEVITEAEVAQVTENSAEPEAVASDKPYQVTDGVISANTIEGWKTYNGGGCGACHGKGGSGAVGPNLANSVSTKLSKEQFINIVTNGKSGTLMRPNKTNKRVMDNLDNLYAYLVARGDDVLGPGNLIKLPLGK
jgi:mono/diheme cytochrome c family protein